MKKIAVVIFTFLLFSFCFAQENPMSKMLSYQDALNLAVQNNLDLKKQVSELDIANAQYKQASGNFDFVAGGSAQYQIKPNDYSENTFNSLPAGSVYVQKLFNFGLESKLSYQISRSKITGSDIASNSGSMNLQLSLPLLKSFDNSIYKMQTDSAKTYIEQKTYDLQDATAKVLINASKLYCDYFLACKNCQYLKELQKTTEDCYKNTEILVKNGVRSQSDLLSIQVNIKSVKQQISNAELSRQSAKLSLMKFIGITDSSVLEISFDEYPVKDFDFSKIADPLKIDDSLISYVIQNRSDLASLKKARDYREIELKMQKTDCLPDISVGLSVGNNGSSSSDNFGEFFISPFENVKGVNFSASVSGSVKIGNNTKKGALDSANEKYQIALSEYENSKNNVILQIQNADENLKLYKEMIVDSEEVTNLQKNLLENQQKRFNAGLITVDTLSSQEQNYLQSKISYSQTICNYIAAILEYKYMTASFVSIDEE
jgi:outer membrane protein TolC